MAHLGSRRGVTNLGLPLMLLTFLLIGGFMYWLYVTAEPTQPAVEEVAEEEVEEDLGATTVDAQALKSGSGGGPEMYEGQFIRVPGVSVSQMVGSEAFFVDLPATAEVPSQPFLVRALTDSASAVSVAVGDRVNVTGTVYVMSDSVVTSWLDAGLITEANRPLVEFSTHFMEADQVTRLQAAAGASSSGS